MTPQEALTALHRLTLRLLDMGLVAQAGETESRMEILGAATMNRTHPGVVEVALQLARSSLPPGPRGWARLTLRRPEEALALARMVTILRAVR